MKETEKQNEVPIWQKYCLDIHEAAEYFNIGECKLRDLVKDSNCPFVLYVGTKRLIKRVKFEQYLENEFSL